MINVTKTFFPEIDDYYHQLKKIWQNQWLTNNGELYKELINKLKDYLNVDFVIPMTNGTLPIQIALNAFGNKGEVITTPFSYVATTASIVWEGCKPVYVDINPINLTIDENKVEDAITEKTTCILATHVYGNPCNVEVIEDIANKYNLKVIYDAAHCFGVEYENKSIFCYGDVSTCSFHATKLFHTAEGGALFCQDKKTYQNMYFRHNFGHNGPLEYHGLGINAKMSELQAAMGLSVFPYISKIIEERKKICEFYDISLDFSKLNKIVIRDKTKWNYSYYPVIFKTEEKLLQVLDKLKANNIYPRRYFYPSLDNLPYVDKSKNCFNSNSIASKVLCLPLYVGLKKAEQIKIVNIINKYL